jgi:hypothetical protein
MCCLSQVLPALLLDEQVGLAGKQFAAICLRKKLRATAHVMSDNDMKGLAATLLPCLQLQGQPALLIEDLCWCMAFVAAHTVNWETAMDDLGKPISIAPNHPEQASQISPSTSVTLQFLPHSGSG